jgi:ribonuclease P protein component
VPTLFTYQKKDKLKSRKQTQFLFSNGQSIHVAPIRLIYTIEQATRHTPVSALDIIDAAGVLQVGVSAPTRYFRKAVMRNRVKRLLREAYRLEKPYFLSQCDIAGKRVNVFLLYTNAQVETQIEVQQKVRTALTQLAKKINAIV